MSLDCEQIKTFAQSPLYNGCRFKWFEVFQNQIFLPVTIRPKRKSDPIRTHVSRI